MLTVTDSVESTIDLSNGVDQDAANARDLVIRWNIDKNYPVAITDIHIYVKQSGDSRFHFLGKTRDGSATSLIWDDNNEFIHSNFQDEPQFGQSYEFQLFLISFCCGKKEEKESYKIKACSL